MMGKAGAKRIMLGIMLCGAVCNAAYAETYDITRDETWNVPRVTGDDDTHAALTDGDRVNIDGGAALTVNISDSATGGVTSGVAVSGAGSLSLIAQAESNASGISSTGSAVTVTGLESLSISRDEDVTGSGFSTGISVHGGGMMAIGGDGGESAVGTLDITARQHGIDMDGALGSVLTINAGTVAMKHSGPNTGGSGIITGAMGTAAGDPNTIKITAENISMDGFRDGIYNEGNSSVTINQTGTGGSLDIKDISFAGVEAHGGSTVINSEGTINITGDGTASYGIYSDAANAVTINSSGDINISGMSGSVGSGLHSGAAVTGTDVTDGITIQGLNGKNVNSLTISGGYCGIWGAAEGGIRISDVNAMTLSGGSYGIRASKEAAVTISDTGTLEISGTSWGIYPNAENAVNISGAEAVNFTGNTAMGIYTTTENSMTMENVKTVTFKDNINQGIYSAGRSGVNITNAGAVIFEGNGTGIYSAAEKGVRITDAGTVIFDGNTNGIYTMAEKGADITAAGEVKFTGNTFGILTVAADGAGITGTDGGAIEKLTFTDNECGMAAGNGGSLNFTAKELAAAGGENIAYASGSGSSVTITAESASINGQTASGDSSWHGSFEAEEGGVITLTAGSLEAERTDGRYLGYVWDEDSSLSIKADTGTIRGAFWTKGSDDDPENTAAGTLALDLGTDTSWTITQDSKLTDLTLGDASALAFVSAGDGSWTHLYTNNLYSNAAGSTINMNIDGTGLNQSDHIYIMGEHTGESAINLIGNGRDLTDEVIGTRLVSVGTENGSFTAGAKYEGALKWYDYTLNRVDGGAAADLSNGRTVTNTEGYNTDWYIDGYKEADSQDPDPDPDPEPAPDPEPTPDPGPGPAQPDGNTTTVDAVIAANAVNYYAFREQDKLLRRMGELRNNGEDEQGIWIRVKGAKTGRSGSFENKYVHYEGGYDTLVKNDHREKRYEGFSISHTEGDVRYKEVTGSGKAHDEEIAFYRVDQYKHGHYLDLVTRIGIYNNRFGVYDTNRNKISARNHNYGISTSAEYGRKKDYAHGWYAEPQTQVTLGYLSGSDYTTSNQVDVSNGSISSAVGRIGVNIGRGFTDKNGRRGKFYAKANWLKEFLGSYGIDMVSDAGNRVHAHGNYKDTWFEWGFGVTYQYTKNNFFYADVEKSEGSSYYKNWAWNAGLRWTFN